VIDQIDPRKILVTGANGLVGSEFDQVTRVSRQDYDLSIGSQCNLMFETYKPKWVIHTAARVGGVWANMQSNGDYYRDNVLINTNVIDQAQKHGVEKLICFLSTCIFPDQTEYPLDETKIHLGAPHPSNFGYAYAKRMCDIQISAYNQQFGTEYFGVIPTNIYGPNDNFNLDTGHALPSLIHRCYLAKINNVDLTVWGSGKPLREFIFSKDVAEICLKLLESDHHTSPVILSTSEEISIADLVVLICDKMKFKGRIVFDTSKPDGQYRKNSTNAKLLSIIKDYKFTPLDQGIELTVNHFCENISHIRK
jgi:GDP-L-fucose synthase